MVMAEQMKTENTRMQNGDSDLEALTEREQAVFWRVIQGSRSVDIAKQMLISRHTVDTHRRNIIKKLNFSKASDWFLLAKEA